MIETAKRLGDVQEYYFSRKLREIAAMNAAGKQVLNLGIGSPDLAPPSEAIAELVAQSQQSAATNRLKRRHHAHFDDLLRSWRRCTRT